MATRRPLLPVRRVTPRDVTDRLYEARVPLALATLGVLLALVGWWGYGSWRARQEDAAQYLVTRGLEAFNRNQQSPAGEKPEPASPQDAHAWIQPLRQARQDYPSSKGAEQALLLMGNLYYTQKEYQQALDAYQHYLEEYPGGAWVFLAAMGKGYALESLQRFQDAAETFRAVAERYNDHPLRPELLMGLARSLAQFDQRTEALATYERVIQEFPGTRWSTQAQTHVASLQR